MPLSDTTKRKFDQLIGVGSADEIVSLGEGTARAASPTFTGTISVGGAADDVGFFGAIPVPRPSGSDQAPIGAFASGSLTGMVGVPATTIPDVGATYNQMALNNIVASVAVQLNNVQADLATIETLVNRLRADLVTLGLIKGGP